MANRIEPIMKTSSWVPADGASQCLTACNKKNPGGGTSCGGNGDCAKCWKIDLNGKTTYQCFPLNTIPNDIENISRPATQAAFVNETGSPQYDPFEGGKFDPYAYAGPFTDTYITTVNDSLCRCGTNIGCGGNCDCNRGGACYCWVVQIYKRSNDGKPGVWSAPTYLCAQTAAIAFSTFNARQGRTRGIPNLFDNFPISHPLNNNPIK